MNKRKQIRFTEEQRKYIDENYHNTSMQEMMDRTNLSRKQIEGYAYYHKLHKDENFHAVKQDGLSYQQIDFIIDNYSSMTNEDIANIIGCTKSQVSNVARTRNLEKNHIYKKIGNLSPTVRQFIIDNYATMLTADIARITGASPQSIRTYAYAHGIRRDKDKCPTMSINKNGLTNEQKRFIIDNYANMSNEAIAAHLDVSIEQIHGYASNKHLQKRTDFKKTRAFYLEECLKERNNPQYNQNDYLGHLQEPKIPNDELFISKYGKYHVNDKYFEVIDNEWKAYWLGFLYADGCVQCQYKSYGIIIGLSIVDRNHIQSFLNSVQSDTFIRDYHTNYKDYFSSKATISNKKMAQDLVNLGCVPNKSLTLKFPSESIVPKHLLRHFIRGYFDGDGCISVNLDKRNVVFSVLGTYDFVDKMQQIFVSELGISSTKILRQKDNQAFHIEYGNIYTVKKIFQYLYKDANIFLQRKFDKFNTVFCLV